MLGACPYPAPHGSQTLIRMTALAAGRAGHDVRLIVYGYGLGEACGGDVKLIRASVPPFGRSTKPGPALMKPYMDISLLRTLRRTAKDWRLDLIHAHNIEALLIARVFGKAPIVYHAHNAMSDELPYFFGEGVRGFGNWLDRHAARAAQVIVPHDSLRDYYVSRGVAPARVSVIAPAVELEAFESPVYDDGATPYLLYTGNADGYQNLKFLFRAFTKLRSIFPALKLVLALNAGAESIRRSIPAGVEIVPGDFGQVRAMLRREVIVVSPRASWSGYPMKLLNAMAAGRPIVACKSAGHPLEHERTALVIADNDEEQFIAAASRLIESHELRATLGRAARLQAAEAHGVNRCSAALDEVYAKVFSSSREG